MSKRIEKDLICIVCPNGCRLHGVLTAVSYTHLIDNSNENGSYRLLPSYIGTSQTRMKSRFSHNSINGHNIFLLDFFIRSGTIWAPQIDSSKLHNNQILGGSLRAGLPFLG